MNFDFLTPVEETITTDVAPLNSQTVGSNITIHSAYNSTFEWDHAQIAILGVEENSNAEKTGNGKELHFIRACLYRLFIGKWTTKIADFGNIKKGNTASDTHFAVKEIIGSLLKKNIIPILIGGDQSLTFANYKAYDLIEQTVNLTTVDSMFDLGTLEDTLSSDNYLSKIIMQTPNNLFNYSNIGYQTYFNSQEEIALLKDLHFDIYRLGTSKNMELIESVLRDTDMVSIDIGCIRQSEAPAGNHASPNGFYGEEICAISKYAGISDKVSSFGIYEYNAALDTNHQTAHLIAQMIWYFIEGVNARAKDYPYCTKDNYQKFIVLFDDDDPIHFYKSDKTGRWWMEINLIKDNKYKRHALIPCTYQDYMEAMNQKIPERWYLAMRKMI
ncbi:MAG: arginase [Flavobacteriaceae bacterium]|nr:MAG: arginase [Flavobacteriaceae bacterium]